MPAILRKPDVIQRTGLSASTIDRLERDGAFPRRRQLGPKAVGWLASELDEWEQALPMGKASRQASACPSNSLVSNADGREE